MICGTWESGSFWEGFGALPDGVPRAGLDAAACTQVQPGEGVWGGGGVNQTRKTLHSC